MNDNERLLERASEVLLGLANRLGESEHPCPNDYFAYMDHAAEDEHGHRVPGGSLERVYRSDLYKLANACSTAIRAEVIAHLYDLDVNDVRAARTDIT